jgi:hypothetical protein
MTKDEIIEYQTREATFAATPLGKAFYRFKSCISRAVQLDTEDSYTDRDRKSTKEAWENAKQAENEIRQLLDELVIK